MTTETKVELLSLNEKQKNAVLLFKEAFNLLSQEHVRIAQCSETGELFFLNEENVEIDEIVEGSYDDPDGNWYCIDMNELPQEQLFVGSRQNVLHNSYEEYDLIFTLKK